VLLALSLSPAKQEQAVKTLKIMFAKSKQYKKRQLFLAICFDLMAGDPPTFDLYFKLDFLLSVDDPIVNVRLVMARGLA